MNLDKDFCLPKRSLVRYSDQAASDTLVISLLVMPSHNKGTNPVSFVILVLHLRYICVKKGFKPRHGTQLLQTLRRAEDRWVLRSQQLSDLEELFSKAEKPPVRPVTYIMPLELNAKMVMSETSSRILALACLPGWNWEC